MKIKLMPLKKINLVNIFKLDKVERQLILIVSVAIFLVINFLLSTLSLRLDFSNGRAYTLSSSTKKIIRNLDDLVNIRLFVSSDLPTRLLPLKSDVIDFLNEYQRQSGGKIRVKILDPKKDINAQNEVQEAGIPQIQFSQLEQGKYALTAVYFGIELVYGDKKEIIPQVTDLESLEYNLTAVIYRLVKKQIEKIAVIGKTESFDVNEDDLVSLKKVLRQQFELSFLDLTSESVKKIDQSFKSILVFDDNSKEYTKKEIDKIKNYLENKGTAIFFVDGVWVLDNLQTDEAKHNLFSLIKDWGITVNKNLVLSTSAEIVPFGNESIQFFTPYPFWIRTNNFNQKLSYFSNISQLTFPWVASLKLTDKKNIETTEIVNSTKKSWEQKNNFILNPQAIPQPEEKELQSFVIIGGAKKKEKGEIVVIPSSRFVLQRYLSRNSDNLEFVVNVLNNLASGGVLAGIRQRTVSFYPLPDLPDNQQDIFKYLNILLLPGLFALYGGIKLLKRH